MLYPSLPLSGITQNIQNTASFGGRCVAKTAATFALQVPIFFIKESLPSPSEFFSKHFAENLSTYFAFPAFCVGEIISLALPHYEINLSTEKRIIAGKTIFGRIRLNTVIGRAIGEELIFRGLIDTVLLKKLPQAIIKRISPDHQHLLDHKMAKIARITFSAFLFGLIHDFENTGFYPRVATGFLYSYWRENGASLAELAVLHTAWNLMLAVIVKGTQ